MVVYLQRKNKVNVQDAVEYVSNSSNGDLKERKNVLRAAVKSSNVNENHSYRSILHLIRFWDEDIGWMFGAFG